jgi:hypothetical protein
MLTKGGGGYNFANTARCWSYCTSIALGVPISSDIPEFEHYELFGPGFDLYGDCPALVDGELARDP